MANDVILYRTDDGESAIELHFDNGYGFGWPNKN